MDEQQAKQLQFERDYAEAQVGRLFVQGQHQQEMIERLMMILQSHNINPQTGEKMEETNGSRGTDELEHHLRQPELSRE
jgi:hypothetical protein